MAKPTSPGKALDHAASQAQTVLADVPPIITPPELPQLPDHPEFPETSVALPEQTAALPDHAQIPEAVQLPEWLF